MIQTRRAKAQAQPTAMPMPAPDDILGMCGGLRLVVGGFLLVNDGLGLVFGTF